ncbi:MAG TPA: hypothetical protein VKG61_22485 [Streptosporangiaceae bacterium]|nr:hypothetical protein [Streptosporangiaceae bacterium]
MSTQYYTPDVQAASQQHTAPQGPRRPWPWALVMAIGVTVVVAFTLAIVFLHGGSVPAQPSNGPSTSTSAPSQPHTPVNPAVPTTPAVNPAVPTAPAGQSAN